MNNPDHQSEHTPTQWGEIEPLRPPVPAVPPGTGPDELQGPGALSFSPLVVREDTGSALDQKLIRTGGDGAWRTEDGEIPTPVGVDGVKPTPAWDQSSPPSAGEPAPAADSTSEFIVHRGQMPKAPEPDQVREVEKPAPGSESKAP